MIDVIIYAKVCSIVNYSQICGGDYISIDIEITTNVYKYLFLISFNLIPPSYEGGLGGRVKGQKNHS